MKEYGPAEYFGELALLRKEPRAADVVAGASPTILVSIDQDSFNRMLGSLNSIMEERANKAYGGRNDTTANGTSSPSGGGLMSRLFGNCCEVQKSGVQRVSA